MVLALGLANSAQAQGVSDSSLASGDDATWQQPSATLAASAWMSPLLWGLIAAVVAAAVAVWMMGLTRRGGLGKNCRDVREFPAWLWLSGAAMVYAGMIVGTSIARSALGADPNASRVLALSTVGGQAVALCVGVMLARIANEKNKRSGMTVRVGDVRRGLVAFVIIAPFFLATSVAGTMVYSRVTGKAPDNAAHALLRMYKDNPGDPWIWVLLGSAVLLAPIVEELIYRAFLQTCFLALWKRAWVAVFSTSILFTLAHVGREDSPNVPWHALPTLFVLSLGMGVAYERSGRLGVPILMHILFNAANVGMMLWMMRGA